MFTEKDYFAAARELRADPMNTFLLGYSVGTGHPCILIDRDSVLCEFPSLPKGMELAVEVCKLLNRDSHIEAMVQ